MDGLYGNPTEDGQNATGIVGMVMREVLNFFTCTYYASYSYGKTCTKYAILTVISSELVIQQQHGTYVL